MDELWEGRHGRRPRRPAPAPQPDRPPRAAGASAADLIVEMQQRVGNHAVARAVAAARSAPARVLQRKNLEQTGWIDGLETLPDRRPLVSDGRDVHVYAQVVERSDDRLAAQQAAAKANARLGAKVDDEAWSAWRRGSNEKWTRPNERLDDARLNALDPFFYAVRVPFAHGGKDEQIEIYFQHAAKWTAYVQAIFDTSNPATKPLPTMYDVKATGPLGANEPSKSFPPEHDWHAYSNVHDVDPLTQDLFESTTGGGARSFDAYTKVVGEGARWRCVRDHARRLRDDSLFFVISRHGDEAYGVTFRTLWSSWAKVFDKGYDISDRKVAEAIRKETFDRSGYRVKTVDIRDLTVYDYDLDRGRSYEPEEEESALKRKREKKDEGSDKKRRRTEPSGDTRKPSDVT